MYFSSRLHILLFTFLVNASSIFAQMPAGIREIEVEGNRYPIYGLCLSPDNKYLAVSSYGGRFYMMDVSNKESKGPFSQGEKLLWSKLGLYGFKWGAKPLFTADGKYVLFKPTFDHPTATKLQPTVCAVFETATGNLLIEKGDEVLSACFLPDSKTLLISNASGLELIDIESKKTLKTIPFPNIEAIASSHASNLIAISYEPSKEELSKLETIEGRKSELKNARINKKMVGFYDLDSMRFNKKVLDEMDIVFRMQFSPDNSSLFLMTRKYLGGGNKDNLKQEGSAQNLMSINFVKVNVSNAQIDKGFSYRSNFVHCDFACSQDGKHFAFSSNSQSDMFKLYSGIEVYKADNPNQLEYSLNTKFQFFKRYIFPYQFAFDGSGSNIFIGYDNKLLTWDYNQLPKHTFNSDGNEDEQIRQQATVQLDSSLRNGPLNKFLVENKVKGFHVFDITLYKKGLVATIFAPVDAASDVRSQNLLSNYVRTLKFSDLEIPKDKRVKFRYVFDLDE